MCWLMWLRDIDVAMLWLRGEEICFGICLENNVEL